jgi:hypothetical protein
MVTNYRKGATIEYKVMAKLRGLGYSVLRSAGSHGDFDLVAWCHKTVIFIQCKNQKPTSQEENAIWKALNNVPDNCWVALAHPIGNDVYVIRRFRNAQTSTFYLI